MTKIGAGGVVIERLTYKRRFKRDYKKLDKALKDRVDEKIKDLKADSRPPGLAFEKLSGYTNPDIYTIHVTGNYKISIEINGSHAELRRVGTHNEIDRLP